MTSLSTLSDFSCKKWIEEILLCHLNIIYTSYKDDMMREI